MYKVHAADIDGDGDMDLLTTSERENKLLWSENTDGKGTFSAPKLIDDTERSPVFVHAADIDGDGDMDVLSRNNDEIAWYENKDGKGTFSAHKTIASDAGKAYSVYAADIDGD
eukprot:g6464.t1